MKIAIFVAVLLPVVLCSPAVDMSALYHLQTDVDMGRDMDHLFKAFKQVHQKKYDDDLEELTRRQIFEANINYIRKHNIKYAKGEKSYTLGVNHFTDLTNKEFVNLYTGHLKARVNTSASLYLPPYNVLLPESVDWRDKNLVTEVKNQGQCGSCWSFSATGSLEGQNAKATGKLISLSEQQLVDCSGTYGNQGCNGGLMDQAFEYIKAIGGIESESDYPYEAREEYSCHFKKSLERVKVSGYVDIEEGSESKLLSAVATVGPISIAIDASHPTFQSYRSGVYDEPNCSSTQLDHGVLIVGYGVEDGQDYWLVKNSWGAEWGEEGYIKMSRNKENQCGIASQASYPTVPTK
ncbi:hypothetical protein ACF0H5_008121 [Mactra antiquata]